ncbi:helix-turn-helix domain-containing protein [Marinobacterium sp. D7]|uniref:helix-turn-helix domain-containing protein n=1 Tax=Marinobacterium ramblicola TaxID=2849041 RepID=UPI001C2DA87A|nr:helix-turn-helix transcriptional regulator [Marinobacterium ramblicola]MBV1788631.1 helix-turn-helix domain-containing protein [Marinobacterium ramblicola]
MNAHIDYRINEIDGRRYAVVPLEQFTALMEQAGEAESLTIPNEVVSRHLVDDVPMIRAWREYLDVSQQELASRLDVSQSQVAQWERLEARPRHTTFKRIASALGIHISQLTLEE